VTFLQRTFTSLVHAHAGRTQAAQPDKYSLSPFLQRDAKNPPSNICAVSRALAFNHNMEIILKNIIVLISALILMTGCVAFKSPIPVGYSGTTTTISDSYSDHEGSTAHFYIVNKINGLFIEDSGYKTRVANSGRGFNMTPTMLSREIATIEQTITIAGFVQFATDGQAMFGDSMLVSGDIKFTPQAHETYKVNGKLDQSGSEVWLENSKGEIVSEVVKPSAKKS
jgi:hypothetical protein